MEWERLKYWNSGEFQVVEERLADLRKRRIVYNPSKGNLFAALKATPFDTVKVCLVGQDPYPKHEHATGIAFSIPPSVVEKDWPPTLVNILKEYCSDLHYPMPVSGDLTKWAKQGVLLWNCIPSCEMGKAGSHDWYEWSLLTQEIVEKLDEQGPIVFAFLGYIAQEFAKYVQKSKVISTSHPSPLGARHGFTGSRLFSTINVELCALGKEAIDWRL